MVTHRASTQSMHYLESRAPRTPARERFLPVRGAAIVMGAVLVIVAVLGFIPGITAHYSGFAGTYGSQAELFGLFRVSILAGVLHFVLGAVGLLAARHSVLARGYLVWVGGFLAFFAWYGPMTEGHGTADIFSLDIADNWLHLALGGLMLLLGISLTEIDRLRGRYPGPP